MKYYFVPKELFQFNLIYHSKNNLCSRYVQYITLRTVSLTVNEYITAKYKGLMPTHCQCSGIAFSCRAPVQESNGAHDAPPRSCIFCLSLATLSRLRDPVHCSSDKYKGLKLTHCRRCSPAKYKGLTPTHYRLLSTKG